MSIFGSIMSKIFEHGGAKAAPATQTAASTTREGTPVGSATPAKPADSAPTNVTLSPAGTPPAAASQDTSSPSTVAQTPAAGPVDVGAVLDGLAAKNSQKLDWKHSIVDMLKLLDLDSSLDARKTLAQELHYGGDTSDSASMNIWLHKQVMQKLAANGGTVPDDLKG